MAPNWPINIIVSLSIEYRSINYSSSMKILFKFLSKIRWTTTGVVIVW